MKFKFLLLSLTIFAAQAAGQALPANAQEGGGSGSGIMDGGNRWVYRPNVWGSQKKPKIQPKAYVPHNVSQGITPTASSMLGGLSPADLKPAPATPPVQKQVQAIASIPHVQAAPFRNDFGAPVTEHIAQSKPMTESSMPAAKSMTPTHIASNSDLHGRLVRRPVYPTAQSARAVSLPIVQNYGPQGYTPGAFGAGSGAAQSTNTAVSGVIVSKRH